MRLLPHGFSQLPRRARRYLAQIDSCMVRCSAPKIRVCSLRLTQKHLFHFEPVVHSFVPSNPGIVRRAEENPFSLEASKLAWVVVDQIIRSQNALIATADA